MAGLLRLGREREPRERGDARVSGASAALPVDGPGVLKQGYPSAAKRYETCDAPICESCTTRIWSSLDIQHGGRIDRCPYCTSIEPGDPFRDGPWLHRKKAEDHGRERRVQRRREAFRQLEGGQACDGDLTVEPRDRG